MNFSAEQIAQLAQGRIEGNPEVSVSSFGKIEEAGPGQLAFLANPKYEEFLYKTKASIVIINDALVLRQPVEATLIRVPDAYSVFGKLLTFYEQMQQPQLTGIQQPSYVDETATVGENCYIGAFAYIGKNAVVGKNCKIYPQVYVGDFAVVGDNTTLYPGVKIYHHCQVGSQVIIHAGTVIGSDGFGFAPQKEGAYQKIPQTGNVIIEDDVEIGSNTSIDRATLGSTIIGKGSKLDNLVQIAHNVEIGSHTVIAGQAGLSGSSKVGNHVMIGGQAGVAGHIKIGDGVRINGQSGVTKSIEKGATLTGTPADDYGSAVRSLSALRRLPELVKQITQLQNELTELKTKFYDNHAAE